ncbi:LiaI-LiaF-like domain-containing protein [Mucilaginibacter sp. AW1-7]|jgi:hypothetical protein|uniref:LiaI-LiaF-like domain-containing protein n=1 Tax=unclassified Mucilaginibacter TaxID=2617802 RepID=UPI0008C73E7E|nr:MULTISPECIES: DUF5668 domain-containing protein [unclassified Mucilaginibacter]WDF79220.1 DUF5668 domain-containing protein [Mucilaginibacter sp. KACC 22773]SEO47991.1 hypothetical protein SAMN05428947_102512 [Mucilaginibacter sp. OK283]
MKTDRLIPGTILVCIGAIFLLHNFHIFHFQWMNILYLWPIFLIIGGVNLVFAGNRSPLATVVKLAVIIGGFSLLLFGNFGNRYHFWPSTFINFDDDHDNDNNDSNDDSDSTNTDHGVTKIEGSSVFNKDYTADAKFARLNINGGATTYTLNDTTSQLFKAETKEFYGKYEFNANKEDSVYVLNFKMKGNKGWHFDSDNNKSNLADIKLNPNPIWDIYVETGATKLDFDLSKFKIKSVTLKGGAASFEVKLGAPLASTNVEVSTGVSEVIINVPKDAACSINANTGLSSNEFEGFTKKNDNSYETPGFDAAKNKIYIHMNGGISDFKVNRY